MTKRTPISAVLASAILVDVPRVLAVLQTGEWPMGTRVGGGTGATPAHAFARCKIL